MRMLRHDSDSIQARNHAYSALIPEMNTKLVSGNNRSGQYSGAAVTQAPLQHQRLRAVEDAFASLPARYLGADPGFSASYRIELDDLGLSWAVELDELAATSPPRPSATRTS